jgi:hypothetical protein
LNDSMKLFPQGFPGVSDPGADRADPACMAFATDLRAD